MYTAKVVDRLMSIVANEPREYWQQEHFLMELPGKWERSLVAIDDSGVIQGFLVASLKGLRRVHINKLAVSPECRGKGIGERLIQAMLSDLPTFFCSVTLKVYNDNEGAIRFYERLGFTSMEIMNENRWMSLKLSSETVVAIHQPNFIPWLGYFYKLAQADKFVFLDNVQFTKNSFVNRVQLPRGDDFFWLSVPIRKSSLQTPISGIELHEFEHHARKLLATVKNLYSKSAFSDEVMPMVEDVMGRQWSSLADLNKAFIVAISNRLGLSTDMVTALEMSAGVLQIADANERLAAITKELGGRFYLHGKGGLNYQEKTPFDEKNIGLVQSDFDESRIFEAFGISDMPKGMSILHLLFNIGFNDVKAMIQKF
jgi:GNAT superfamily N-acetyltransferase